MSASPIQRHFTILTFPFRHLCTGPHRKNQLRALSGRWKPWWSRLANTDAVSGTQSINRALDDTYFFLPSLRESLYPETQLLHGGASEQVEQLRELAALPVDRLAEKIHNSAMLRLTLSDDELEPLHQIQLLTRQGSGDGISENSFSFHICWADVMLFPQHVGVLAIKVALEEKEYNEKQLADFLHSIRSIHPPYIGCDLPDWQAIVGGNPLRFKSRDIVDILVEGLAEETTLPVGISLVDRLHFIARHDELTQSQSQISNQPPVQRGSETPLGQVYGQTFRLYSYACLKEAYAEKDDLFNSPVERTLYELATCTNTAKQTYIPHPTGITSIMDLGHIARWANWQGMALHDNVVFLGTVANDFTLGALPNNIENDYLALYFLVIYQKFRLSFLSMDLMRRDVNLQKNTKEATKLWEEFLQFRNHYWFHEVTLKPQGAGIYQKFRQGLAALPLYESVSEELNDLQEHYERKNERGINRLLTLLAVIGFPLSILAEIFGDIIPTTWCALWLVSFILIAILSIGYYWISRESP